VLSRYFANCEPDAFLPCAQKQNRRNRKLREKNVDFTSNLVARLAIYSRSGCTSEEMNRLPKFWIVTFAILAAAGILFVLITPAPDELPSTGPHALNSAVLLAPSVLYLLPYDILSHHGIEPGAPLASATIDLLSITCTRLC
jgi:hypothetical protein